jgi:uncharacterized protein YcfJ
MKRGVPLILLVTFLTACAGYRPVVDMQGVDTARYEADLRECQQYAQQRDPATQAAAGAVVGALLGVALAAAMGSNYSRNTGAAIGAVSGGASGSAHGAESQIQIVRNCMAGRGYRVLN